uniref:non-specific serine/threonine protein kinase n=1 Tax=Kalanchoe fedtschenkoi TaxID=63787 RepID=A0A7N0TMR0_KALFE
MCRLNMRPTWRWIIILSTISVVCSASTSPEEENDRLALMTLRDGLMGSGAPSPGGALSSWNNSVHFCQWQGVVCGGDGLKRVISLELSGQMLSGTLSPSIGNLTFLEGVFLSNNSLRGDVPKEIGNLGRLQFLFLRQNSLQGRIPAELSNCTNLLRLSLSHNNLTGGIPSQFGSLLQLIQIDVINNNLAGEVPTFLRNFSSLNQLFLGHNQFHGEIRDSIQGLSKLVTLSVESNSFSGAVFPLHNLSSLQIIEISDNSFTGALAPDMDAAFPKASFLSFARNHFIGALPPSLSNLSGLSAIQAQGNGLAGRVPDNLGKLSNLVMLQLGNNILGSEKSNDLSFIHSLTNCTKLKRLILGNNRFSGQLPDSIGNFTSDLQALVMGSNSITGSIPEGIGELSGLYVIHFASNSLSGTIPNSIGKLTKISEMHLQENNLRGGIPSSIGNLTNLLQLSLSMNSLDGNIPKTLANCKSMEIIDVSRNLLHGNLPEDVFTRLQDLIYCNISHNSYNGMFPSVFGKLRALNTLDASYNNFSGEIPAQLGDSSSLEFLNMAGNSFNGSIPGSVGRLRGLKWLDLSNNNLSGAIPKELADIAGLENLNLSFNHLKGEVPLLKNVAGVSVAGNINLCGGSPELQLHPCVHQKKGNALSRKAVIAITLSAVFVSISLSMVALLFIFHNNRRKHKKDQVEDWAKGYQRVTYAQLFKATEGFAEANLIGRGGFGDVYRGILDQDEGKPVAVKVLNLLKHGASKSFTAECRILRRTRHRNLLSIITSCSSLDYKGNDFKALVFEFMSNGNLDSLLHLSDTQNEARVLTLAKRIEIAIDVGCALDYLHNGCETPIVHCDLKPSNILLDDDMVAHVGDFGLAKLFHDVGGNLSGGESLSSAAVKGTIGYVAPEYGMGAEVSPQGDIYSYGILLLELITGRRPTDDNFNDGMSIQSFCRRAVPDHVDEIVDGLLVNELHEAILTQRNPEEIKLQCVAFLVSFVEVGISCAAESPRDRMDIQSAIRSLKGIKEKYHSTFK